MFGIFGDIDVGDWLNIKFVDNLNTENIQELATSLFEQSHNKEHNWPHTLWVVCQIFLAKLLRFNSYKYKLVSEYNYGTYNFNSIVRLQYFNSQYMYF